MPVERRMLRNPDPLLPLLGSQNTGSKASTVQPRDWKLPFGESDQQTRKKS